MKRDSRWNARHMGWLVCIALGLLGLVACGPPTGATPCKTIADCFGDQLCQSGECKEPCKSDNDCLGDQYCDKGLGACKDGKAPPPRPEPPDANEPTPDRDPPADREPPIDREPPGPTCGDGNIEGTEACEGANLNGKDCLSEGFVSGTLKCNACQLDTSGCQAAPDCGNGKIDANEACDGTDLNSKSCQSEGFDSGTLKCSGSCRLDTSGCSKTPPATCGDNKAEGTEACDGTDLNGKDCQSEGFPGGTIKCNACQLDTSGCTGTQAKKKFGQLCAKTDDCDTGLTCITAKSGDKNGYCTAECSDTKPCPTSPVGAGCILTLTSGTQICGWSCSPGDGSCPTGLNCIAFSNGHICAGSDPEPPAKCGDNKAASTEECDGTDLNSQTCQTQGFASGTIKCNACKFDTSGCKGPPTVAGFGKACTSGSCGTGLICVNFGANVGAYCTANCSATIPCPASKSPASCSIKLQSGGSVCGWGTSSGAPPICGNGVIDPGEDCDKTAFGATCKGLAYSGGNLKCTNTCTYDKSSCTGTPTCTLPALHCGQNCSQIVAFLPTSGPGYIALHGSTWSWAKRSTMAYVKYAAASVDCVYPGTKPLGLGDMSESNGGTPQSNGRLRHPTGTHVNGSDMDIAYYQKGTANNHLRAVCTHTSGGADQYHCVSQPTLLDPTKSAFFIAKLLESGAVRVIGVDGKIGPLVKAAMTQLHTSGMITKVVLDRFNAGAVTWEETDTQRGWFRFHHHHLHVSIR